MKNICVYCGSSLGARPEYQAAARELGTLMGRMGLNLVYGGGRVGLMGEVANAVLEAGGHATGVITERLVSMEVAHTDLSELRVVRTMHERKAAMAELADGFIALPGGIGTYEEFFEIATWARLGVHNKPCGLLNTAHFYDKLIEFIDFATRQQFIPEAHRQLMLVADTPEALLAHMQSRQAQISDGKALKKA